jgi:hypothetical protein
MHGSYHSISANHLPPYAAVQTAPMPDRFLKMAEAWVNQEEFCSVSH